MAQFDENPELDEEVELEEPSDEPSEPQEPKLVRVRLNGKTVEVTEEVADAIHAREEAYQRKMSEQGAELGRLRQQTRQEAPQTPQNANPDEDLEFFTSPTQALNKRLQSSEERIAEKIRNEYALERAREQFWSTFYTENPTFRGRERFVQAIVAQEYDSLKDLPPDQCRQELANIVRGELGDQPTGVKRTLTARPVVTERAGTPARSAPTKPTDTKEPVSGIQEEVRRKAEARRRAAHNLPKE